MSNNIAKREAIWLLMTPITVMIYVVVSGLVMVAIAKGFGYLAGFLV